MKNNNPKSTKKQYRVVYSRKQRFWGWFALIMLFICGIMVGVGINNGSNHNTNAAHASTTAEPVVATTEMSACEIIEQELSARLYPVEDMYHYIYEKPNHNIEIYTRLIQDGCPENVEKYTTLLEREKTVVAALTSQQQAADNTTCTQIEESLLVRLPDDYAEAPSEKRIERAKIYANLSERGCPENRQKYYDLAKQELEIARAIKDDEFNQDETIEVVETYKRLNMQAAAEEIFETAKKLTNPTIDFILSVEKIINEQ